MIVKVGRYRYYTNHVSYIIILISTALVTIRLQLLSSPCGWNAEAWEIATPKERRWISRRNRDIQSYRCLVPPVSLKSMRQSHDANVKHNCESIDFSIPTDKVNVTNFTVRDCTHGELNMVADIIIDSFYNYTDPNNVWRQLTRLAELNRIQTNFPYGPDRAHHRMLVAVTGDTMNELDTTTTSIFGFVDIDTRIPNRPTSYKYNPRPYLSDLCIHPNYRRYGLASLLIRSCEDYCRSHHRSSNTSGLHNNIRQKNDEVLSTDDDHRRPSLYIRVETTNTIAIQMYQKLGYSILSDHADSNNPNILILYKGLSQSSED